MKPAHRFVVRAGTLLHRFGAPSHRLERVLTKVTSDLGMQGVFLYTPTGLLCSLVDEDGEQTYLRRIDGGGLQVDKLIALDDVLDELSAGRLSVEQAEQELSRIELAPAAYSAWVTTLAYIPACMSVAILFRGSLPEVLAAGSLGMLVNLLELTHQRRKWQSGYLEPLAGLVASMGALVIASLVYPIDHRLVTLSALIVIIPGLRITNALTELAVGHLSSGVARLAGASVSLLTIMAGVAIGSRLAGHLQNLPDWNSPNAPEPLSEAWQWVTILLAPIAFAILFQARIAQWPAIIAVGVAGFCASKLTSSIWGIEVGAFSGALVVALGSNAYARLRDRPALVPFVPGIIVLVPGSLGYRSLSAFLENETVIGIDLAFRMLIVAVSLVAGILTANALLPPRRIL